MNGTKQVEDEHKADGFAQRLIVSLPVPVFTLDELDSTERAGPISGCLPGFMTTA